MDKETEELIHQLLDKSPCSQVQNGFCLNHSTWHENCPVNLLAKKVGRPWPYFKIVKSPREWVG